MCGAGTPTLPPPVPRRPRTRSVDREGVAGGLVGGPGAEEDGAGLIHAGLGGVGTGGPHGHAATGGQSGCQGRRACAVPDPDTPGLPTFPRSCGNPGRNRNSCRGVPRRWWGDPGEAPVWGTGAAPRGTAAPAAAPSSPQNVATVPVPGCPWLISGDAAGDGASRNGEHRKGPPGPTEAHPLLQGAREVRGRWMWPEQGGGQEVAEPR